MALWYAESSALDATRKLSVEYRFDREVKLVRHPDEGIGWHLQEHDDTGPVGPALVPYEGVLRFKITELTLVHFLGNDDGDYFSSEPAAETNEKTFIRGSLYLDMGGSPRRPFKLSMLGTSDAISELTLRIEPISDGEGERMIFTGSASYVAIGAGVAGDFFQVSAYVSPERFHRLAQVIKEGFSSGGLHIEGPGLYADHPEIASRLIKVLHRLEDHGIETTESDGFKPCETMDRRGVFSLSVSNTFQDEQVMKLIETDRKIVEEDEPQIETSEQITKGLLEELVRGQGKLQASVEKSISASWAIVGILLLILYLSK
jgi:hypothetical protein